MISPLSPVAVAATVEVIAHEAGELALRYFRGRSFGIETKGYRDPVTDADKAVERHVHDCVLPFLMTVLSEKKEQARRASPVGIG